jgi:hypothetical protein
MSNAFEQVKKVIIEFKDGSVAQSSLFGNDALLVNALREECKMYKSLTQWQPIETAPKDGTQLLLYCGDEWCGILVGHYGELITWDDITGNEEVETCWQSGLEKYCPTHWMPLPKPPAQ